MYCYPSEHYDYWKRELPGREFPTAIFGENFTVDEMFEDSLCLGDRFRIGTAEVVVTQPRLPCFKLGIRFQDDRMVKRFLAAGRSGFYLAVTKEGEVGAGDTFERLASDTHAVPVSEITRLFIAKSYTNADVAAVRRVLQVSAVPEDWKAYFRDRIDQAGV